MAIKHNQIIANYNKDSSGNAFTVMLTEKHEISPTSYQIQLSQIPSEVQGLRIDDMYEVFDIEDIVENSFKVVSYNDRRVQFHSSKGAKEVTVTYGGIGVEYISAESVWLISDSQGNVIQTLKGWFDYMELQRQIIEVFGDCGKILIEMRETIPVATKLNNDLKSNIATGTPLKESLETNIPVGQALEVKLKADITEGNRLQPILHKDVQDANTIQPKLEQAIASATDINDKIVNTGNKSISITTAMWGSVQSDGKYHYTWSHPMKSQAIKLDTYEVTSKGKELSTVQVIIKDDNTIEFISEEVIELFVVADSRYYGGNVANLNAFSTDNLLEGTNNKYVQSKSYDVLANQFTLVEGLYQATLTHSLNRTKFTDKLAFVNGKQIFVDIDEISNTQVKITTSVAEAMQIKLNFIGGM